MSRKWCFKLLTNSISIILFKYIVSDKLNFQITKMKQKHGPLLSTRKQSYTSSGKYHCTTGFRLDSIGFCQTRKYLSAIKLLNQNQSPYRLAVMRYFPQMASVLHFNHLSYLESVQNIEVVASLRERMFGCFTFAKLGLFCKTKKIFLFLYHLRFRCTGS